MLPLGWGAVDSGVAGDWSLVNTADGTHTGLYLEDTGPSIIELYQAEFSAQCEAAHPSDRWRCMFASVEVLLLTAPSPGGGRGLRVAIAQNLLDPFYENIHGILTKEGGEYMFTPGGQAASDAYGDLVRANLTPLRWVYAPRHPLRFHGIPPNTQPEDLTAPTLAELAETFVSSPDPDEFSYLDIGAFVSAP